MIENISFSKNFSLYELLQSQSASRLGFDEQFNPPDTVIKNLEALCKNVLQSLRDAIKVPLSISSGYHCPRLNAIIGGASKSQHLTGHAADIQCFKTGNEMLLRKIAELKLPFDQVINEFNYAWVHVSYDANRMRGQVLETVKDVNFKTVYRNVKL